MFDIVKIRFKFLFYPRITGDAPVIKPWLALRFVTGFLCSTIPLKGRVVK